MITCKERIKRNRRCTVKREKDNNKTREGTERKERMGEIREGKGEVRGNERGEQQGGDI